MKLDIVRKASSLLRVQINAENDLASEIFIFII